MPGIHGGILACLHPGSSPMTDSTAELLPFGALTLIKHPKAAAFPSWILGKRVTPMTPAYGQRWKISVVREPKWTLWFRAYLVWAKRCRIVAFDAIDLTKSGRSCTHHFQRWPHGRVPEVPWGPGFRCINTACQFPGTGQMHAL